MNPKKVVVVGDAILDQYLYCQRIQGRIECNAPIIRMERTENRPGGAANVASHVSAKTEHVSLVSLIGDDHNGYALKMILSQDYPSISVKEHTISGVPTTTKKRVITSSCAQMMRIDCEHLETVSSIDQEIVVATARQELAEGSILVISDYEKGCLSFQTCQQLITYANNNGCTVLVDGKHPNPKKYSHAFLLKPNRRELSTMTQMSVNNIEEVITAAQVLRQSTNCMWILVTMDKDGMVLIGEQQVRYFPTTLQSTGDIVGAGDIVIAHIATGLAEGGSLEDVCIKANQSVADAYQHLNYTLPPKGPLPTRADKIVSVEQLEDYLRLIRHNHAVVFTNGCFDIVHSGHIYSLESAAKLGDILVVGVNDDNSVRRNKGDGRPVNPLQDRLCVLSALSCVNFVVPFSEDTPINLIKKIRPDVLVKGGDYEGKNIIGTEYVQSYGGKVVITGYVDGHSTSRIISLIGGT